MSPNYEFMFWNKESAELILELLKTLYAIQDYVSLAQVCLYTDNSFLEQERRIGWFNLDDVCIEEVTLESPNRSVFYLIFSPPHPLNIEMEDDLL